MICFLLVLFVKEDLRRLKYGKEMQEAEEAADDRCVKFDG